MTDQPSDTPVDQGTPQDGSQDLGWRAALPDDLKNHEFIKDYTKPGDAIQDFVKLKTETANMLKVPGEDATDEERAAFYTKLGRPENANDYKLTRPENYPEDAPYDDQTAEAFKGIFHELGIPGQTAEKLWGKYHEITAKGFAIQQQQETDAVNAAIDTLKNENPGDKFKEITEIAHRTFTGLFGDEKLDSEAKAFIEKTKVNGTPIGNHPMFIRMFHKIGTMIGDDKMNPNDGGHGPGMSDEEAARSRFPNTKFKT